MLFRNAVVTLIAVLCVTTGCATTPRHWGRRDTGPNATVTALPSAASESAPPPPTTGSPPATPSASASPSSAGGAGADRVGGSRPLQMRVPRLGVTVEVGASPCPVVNGALDADR